MMQGRGRVGDAPSHVDNTVQIVTVICSLIGTLATVIGVPLMTYLLARLNAKQATAALRVEQVKATLAKSSASTDEKLTAVAEKIEEVHKATNSLTDRLVESTAAESHAKGVMAGKAAAAAAADEELIPDPRPAVNPRHPPPPEPRRPV